MSFCYAETKNFRKAFVKNKHFCNHKHAQYKLETPAEFRRYLPLAIASFATGNNIWGKISRRDGGGHYLTLASIYEGSLYILDPYLKADYGKTDRRHLITQIEPGVLRVSMEDLDELLLYTFYIVDRKPH